MKILNNTIFTTLFFLFIISTAKADDADKKVRIRLMGSGNISWLKPNNDGNFGYDRKGFRLGYTAGIGLDFSLFGSSNYEFSTGINLLHHGGKLSFPDVVYPTETDTAYPGTTLATYKLRYIDIPLTLKLKTNEIGYLTYYGQVGLGLGINIKARQDIEQTYSVGTHKPNDQNVSVADEIALFRVPLIIGGGIEYNLSGNTSLALGLVFSNGFTNVFTKKAPLYELEDDGKTVKLDDKNQPVKITGKKRNALTNYIGVTVGIVF